MRGITITFNNNSIHTGNNLDLVQEIKSIGNPEVQSYLVEVPGRNGLLNLTKGLTGNVCYKNRVLSFQYLATGSREELLTKIDTMNIYHGEKIQIIDDDTPGYYYEGEATVAYVINRTYAQITLTVNANPFREKLTTSTKTTTLSSTAKNITISYEGVPVVPTITVSNTAKIVRGDITHNLSAGTYVLTDLEIKRGSNVYSVSGSGSITFTYREARL